MIQPRSTEKKCPGNEVGESGEVDGCCLVGLKVSINFD